MAKKILILNGSPRRNGKTSQLIQSFTEGALSSGHELREFYLNGMNIHGCNGCLSACKNPFSPCAQKDGMEEIYAAFEECDVVVFASPIYFWTVSAQLKTAADRLYAELECLGYKNFARECVLLATAGGSDYSQAVNWYRNYERNLGWKNRGEVLGGRKLAAAYSLGASL